jgi:hypothetical protein
VRSFPTPGWLPLFSTVTSRCRDARSSHYIAARHRTAPLQTARFLKAVPREKLSDIL